MKSTSCRDVEIRRSTAAMHLRQFMSGKIDVMPEDWLILDGVNVRGKMHHCESSGS